MEVSDRDIWAVGDHILANGDIERGDVGRLLEVTGPPALVYADLPWSPEMLRYYIRKADRPKRKADYPFFARQALTPLAALGLADVWLETSPNWRDALAGVITELGGWVWSEHTIGWWGKTPGSLLRAGWSDEPKPLTASLDGVIDSDANPDAADTVKLVLDELRPASVLDFCMGYGHTARTAHARGIRAFGLELSSARVAALADKLQRLGAGEPRKIGELPPA